MQEFIEKLFSYTPDNSGTTGPHSIKDQKDCKETSSPPVLYFIGIKGTGMCSLAQLFHHLGFSISGSDVTEHFYTDELLRRSGIPYYQGFSAENIPDNCDLIIYSAAYNENNPEFAEAKQRSEKYSLPMLSYPEALGQLSHSFRETIAVAGAHGKTTTTLIGAGLLKALELKATAVAGAAASTLDGNAFFSMGRDLLLVETCEYRNHFFHFQPNIVLLTSLDWDHQDFFVTYKQMEESFSEFIHKDSVHTVVYCSDDSNVQNLIQKLKKDRPNRSYIPYGFTAEGEFKVQNIQSLSQKTLLYLQNFPEYPIELHIPGSHLALNSLGALAALAQSQPLKQEFPSLQDLFHNRYKVMHQGISGFRGASRRCEVIAELPRNILILDDYAHHPTAIQKTLQGVRDFYPGRRLLVDFMSHTYSRTKSLHQEFAGSFSLADILILHDIYPSAREKQPIDFDGVQLWQETNAARKKVGLPDALYFANPLDALGTISSLLLPGDIFLSMGAGNNRSLALALQAEFQRGPQ